MATYLLFYMVGASDLFLLAVSFKSPKFVLPEIFVNSPLTILTCPYHSLKM